MIENKKETRYCSCFHTINHHVIVDEGNSNIGAICFGVPSCTCNKYRQDNLIYLELESKKLDIA